MTIFRAAALGQSRGPLERSEIADVQWLSAVLQELPRDLPIYPRRHSFIQKI